MKIYVETKRGFPVNSDIQKAIDGFESLCYDIVPFEYSDIVLGKYDYAATKNIFVGSIDTMKLIFSRIGKTPEDIDYPSFLREFHFLSRDVVKMKLSDVINCYGGGEIFIKPTMTKLFDGILVTKKTDFNYLKGFEDEIVWVSDKMNIDSEWRVFVHDDKIVHWSNYSGDFTKIPDYAHVKILVKYYTQQYDNAPRSYTIDVAVLKDGKTDVVEFNDFWAIGSYGLDSMKYAEMLRDRYEEIVFEN